MTNSGCLIPENKITTQVFDWTCNKWSSVSGIIGWYLYENMSTNQSIDRSINRSVNQSIDQSIDRSVNQSINQSYRSNKNWDFAGTWPREPIQIPTFHLIKEIHFVFSMNMSIWKKGLWSFYSSAGLPCYGSWACRHLYKCIYFVLHPFLKCSKSQLIRNEGCTVTALPSWVPPCHIFHIHLL